MNSNDYSDGYQSGLHHVESNPLHRENLKKAELGIRSDVKRVSDYWKGYCEGAHYYICDAA